MRLVTAGNQGGKTTIGMYDHACLALGCHKYRKIETPNTGFIVTAKPLAEGVEKDILPKLREVCGTKDVRDIKANNRGIPYKIIWRNGSVSFIMSAEQDDMVFEGTMWWHGWCDEPFRRSIYVALKRGLLVKNGPLAWTCTPIEEPWMYEELVMKEDPNIEVFEGSTDENRRISDAAKEEYFGSLTPEELIARRYGKFLHLSGRVFKTFKKELHRISPFNIPEHWPVWISIDPHRNKPHAVLFLAVSPQGIKYVCNEIYIACTIGELADYILDVGSQYNIVERLIDTSAQEDGWRRESAREILANRGVATKLAQKRNLKKPGLDTINQLFNDDKLFVFDTCKRLLRELELQVYKKGTDEAEKKYDDQTDNLRYILVERPDYNGIASIIEGPEGLYEKDTNGRIF